MRNILLLGLLAISPIFTGCGKEAHREAGAFCQVLERNQPAYNTSNGMERDLVASTRTWAETIMTNGAGHGAELGQNAGVAKELAGSADLISTRLGELRKALYDQEIKKEELQTVRTALNAQISKRQNFLREIRTALQETATEFEGLSQSRAYKGDTYPPGIDRLAALLQSYHSPEDALKLSLQSLRDRYGLPSTGGDI